MNPENILKAGSKLQRLFTSRASRAKLNVRKAAQPIAVPRDLELPTATASAPGGEAIVQTEKRSGDSHTGEAAAGSPVEPAALDRQTH